MYRKGSVVLSWFLTSSLLLVAGPAGALENEQKTSHREPQTTEDRDSDRSGDTDEGVRQPSQLTSELTLGLKKLGKLDKNINELIYEIVPQALIGVVFQDPIEEYVGDDPAGKSMVRDFTKMPGVFLNSYANVQYGKTHWWYSDGNLVSQATKTIGKGGVCFFLNKFFTSDAFRFALEPMVRKYLNLPADVELSAEQRQLLSDTLGEALGYFKQSNGKIANFVIDPFPRAFVEAERARQDDGLTKKVNGSLVHWGAESFEQVRGVVLGHESSSEGEPAKSIFWFAYDHETGEFFPVVKYMWENGYFYPQNWFISSTVPKNVMMCAMSYHILGKKIKDVPLRAIGAGVLALRITEDLVMGNPDGVSTSRLPSLTGAGVLVIGLLPLVPQLLDGAGHYLDSLPIGKRSEPRYKDVSSYRLGDVTKFFFGPFVAVYFANQFMQKYFMPAGALSSEVSNGLVVVGGLSYLAFGKLDKRSTKGSFYKRMKPCRSCSTESLMNGASNLVLGAVMFGGECASMCVISKILTPLGRFSADGVSLSPFWKGTIWTAAAGVSAAWLASKRHFIFPQRAAVESR